MMKHLNQKRIYIRVVVSPVVVVSTVVVVSSGVVVSTVVVGSIVVVSFCGKDNREQMF